MKHRSITGLAGLMTAALFSSAVVAGDAEKGHSQFQMLDQDQDGAISAMEAESSPELQSQWMQLDGDGSGTIDQAEFSAFEEMQSESSDAGMTEDKSSQ
ncbi:hypothetical protein [Motiliproteus sp. SC1-56]|uniref:hypothetical protein n=1 Tax=Motiliproteus sp. SC1-56 TaxID=2799565 RepID=UPI001A9013DC|nr:hypothetical protein [Motiliproteus sp. SC1-56]